MNKIWGWFWELKSIEILGGAALTMGLYYLGKLTVSLNIIKLKDVAITSPIVAYWFIGFASLVCLVLLGGIMAAWINANWKWANRLARKK